MTFKAWLRFARLANALTTIADVSAGWVVARAFTHTRFQDEPLDLAFAVAACILMYATGIITNDVGDRAKDATLHPERPLPSGAVSLTSANAAAATFIACALVLLALIGTPPLIVGASLLSLIMLYNFILPDGSWASSLSMGSCRVAALSLGAVASGLAIGDLMTLPVALPFASYCLLILLTTRISLLEEKRGQSDIPVLFKLLIAACYILAVAPIFSPVPVALSIIWVTTFWFRPPGSPSSWVKRVIFTTPIHGALIACGVGAYLPAACIGSVAVLVAAVRRLINQRSS